MKALVFPGQGSQFPGMGQDLFDSLADAQAMFDIANDLLGFDLQGIMFEGTAEDLRRTSVTQPSIYVHSVIAAKVHGLITDASMAAGHSLGELSALATAGVFSFEAGLKLVAIRANAMQKACDEQESTMAAILGLEDAQVEAICEEIDDIVVPANYNTVGQIVVSGTKSGILRAIELATARGARRALELPVNGAFHSPLMESARLELAAGIEETAFEDAKVPVYQNVTAMPHTHKSIIKENLLKQLTSPVRWTQTVGKMAKDGATEFVEVGPGKVLSGLIKKVDRQLSVNQVS